mgnify:CR=1 FL=1
MKKEAEKPNDKNEEDAEDEMIKEGGKNQEPELAMEEFIEETETEIEMIMRRDEHASRYGI